MTRRLTAAFLLAVVVTLGSCSKDEPTSSGPPPCTPASQGAYGSGTMSFLASGIGDTVVIAGTYRTSNLFLGDTTPSAGAGGFLHDTLVASKPMKGSLMGYLHQPHASYVFDRLIVFRLYNTAGSLTPGAYQLTPASTTVAGMSAQITFLFADSLHPLSLFEAKSGTVTVTSVDTCLRIVQGTFSGVLRDPSDTTSTIQLTGGRFDIAVVNHTFNF